LWLYRLGVAVVSPWNPKAKLWLAGRRDVLEKLQLAVGSQQSVVSSRQLAVPHSLLTTTTSRLPTANRQLIWFHCASLGEFEQGRPLLEAIKEQYPGYRILLTFFSPSGYEIRKNYSGADYISYLPIDSRSNANQLLDIIQPALVIWVKYDYWHFYLSAIRKRNIPLLLISGIFREDQPFFKWYGSFHRNMLSCFTHLFVQTGDSKKLLGTIGYSGDITVNGDTRFDRVITIAEQFQPIPAIEAFINNAPVIVAGSTWSEDEEELDHYANTHPGIKFIIAPHEIDEEHLKDIEKLFHYTVRYSQLAVGSLQPAESSQQLAVDSQESSEFPIPNSQFPIPNVLIIDNIGLLARLYKYATIAYVGGGFGYDGVHNVLEAAVYGKPVVFGPEYEKYAEAIGLEDSGGAFSIENVLELEERLNVLLENKETYTAACIAARKFVYDHKGATGKVLEYIQEKRLLTNW
jgi:3-deoxy-D-manno-octulosonic-acid transferase